MRQGILMGALFVLVFSLALPAGANVDRWIHVSVEGSAAEAEHVRVNLPLSLARIALPLLQKELNANMALENHSVRIAELREAWKELRKARNTDFVTVKTPEADIRVSMARDEVRVTTEEGSATRIEVRIPAEIVDALLSGTGETLDLDAAFEALLRARSVDLVSVRDAERHVKVWIDDRSGS